LIINGRKVEKRIGGMRLKHRLGWKRKEFRLGAVVYSVMKFVKGEGERGKKKGGPHHPSNHLRSRTEGRKSEGAQGFSLAAGGVDLSWPKR